MARWRAVALECLPECRTLINRADRIMFFWTEVGHEFRKACEASPRNDDFIRRVYQFAHWCEDAPRNNDAGRDPFTAVVVGFYEILPFDPLTREDMPRWWALGEVVSNKPVFSYLIGEEGFAELVEFMQANRDRFEPGARHYRGHV
jgi:hypothetical protein